MNRKLLLFLTIFIGVTLQAQIPAPHLEGEVNISRSEGQVRCQFTVSDLPSLGKDYRILLYRGFNIRLLKNDSGKVLGYDGFYNSKLNGEAAAYVLEQGDDTLPLPKQFSVSYTGAFPLYTDTLNSFDFKGFIAFDATALRATEQSKWYPVVYDVANDKLLDNVSYDIRVNCADCKMIYINGDQAQPGPSAHLKSIIPRPLVLFCGNYDKQTFPQSSFLNAGLSDSVAKAFNKNITGISAFYVSYLGSPYGEKLTFLQHNAFEPFAPRRSWGFVVFPTIAVAGQGFETQIDARSGEFHDTTIYRFYAHEMGHYFFGQRLQPNGTLKWFFLESMASFISLKATQAHYGKGYLEWYAKSVDAGMRNVSITPLSSITDPEKIFENYRYIYGPLLLLTMEKQYGPETTRRFCQEALKQTGATNYQFMRKTVKAAGIDEASWKKFETAFIFQTNANAVLDYLNAARK